MGRLPMIESLPWYPPWRRARWLPPEDRAERWGDKVYLRYRGAGKDVAITWKEAIIPWTVPNNPTIGLIVPIKAM